MTGFANPSQQHSCKQSTDRRPFSVLCIALHVFEWGHICLAMMLLLLDETMLGSESILMYV